MKLELIRSRAVLLLLDHVDTDQIIPARFLKTVGREGLAEKLFADWRGDPAFPVGRTDHAGAEILVTGVNFGCGSSREHAPWALLAGGFRAVIAPSFADIFRANALRNGLLPVALDPEHHRRVSAAVTTTPGLELEVDLQALEVRLPGETFPFAVEAFARDCLLRGLDPIDYLLEAASLIEVYEARHG